MSKYDEGNIFEIKLDEKIYAYVCLIEDFEFGVFNIIAEKPLNFETVSNLEFNTFRGCKRGGISKGAWKLIGKINLKEKGIELPDLACYREWDIEGSIESASVIRKGEMVSVDKEYFLKLVDENYIFGFFDDYKKFENWIRSNIEKIKSKQQVKSEWALRQE